MRKSSSSIWSHRITRRKGWSCSLKIMIPLTMCCQWLQRQPELLLTVETAQIRNTYQATTNKPYLSPRNNRLCRCWVKLTCQDNHLLIRLCSLWKIRCPRKSHRYLFNLDLNRKDKFYSARSNKSRRNHSKRAFSRKNHKLYNKQSNNLKQPRNMVLGGRSQEWKGKRMFTIACWKIMIKRKGYMLLHSNQSRSHILKRTTWRDKGHRFPWLARNSLKRFRK